jgi:HSP20 family protein
MKHDTLQKTTPVRSDTFVPHIDVLEKSGEWIVQLDMPGVRRDGLEIEVENDVLSVRGQVAPRQANDASFHLREYAVGDFYRSFQLGDAVARDGIRAEYEGGVLTLHVPKASKVLPRRIQVTPA